MRKKPGRKLKRSKKLRIPKNNLEEYLLKKGYKNIVGLDEVGRGALAGPLVAAAVKLPTHKRLYKIRDSKLLTEKEREELAKKIKKQSKIGFGIVEPKEINRLGLSQALKKAYFLALKNLKITPGFILVDGYKIPEIPFPQKGVIKGDMKVASIASASIVAKVKRDNIMKKLAKKYPGYGFEKNKGYATAEHLAKLKEKGPSPVHRDFAPVKKAKQKLKNKK